MGWEFPDLLVVDGGRGQLNVAQQALADLGVTDLPIAALAKEKPNVLGEKLVDRVYLPGQKNPIEVRENNASLGLLALARDEAHRSSNALRVKLGTKKRIRSRLDEVPGVGHKTRTRLRSSSARCARSRGSSEVAVRAAGATRRRRSRSCARFTGAVAERGRRYASEPRC